MSGHAARGPPTMTPTTESDTPATVVERFFRSYLEQDLAAAQDIAADAMVFTSPQDDHIDRATYFGKCFPTASRVNSQQIMYLVAVSAEDVVLMYEYELAGGARHRNTELITVRDGQVVEVQVFFGGRVR